MAHIHEVLSRYARGERDFRGIDIHSADLAGADLSDARFPSASFSGTNLTGARLVGADFSQATVRGVRFDRALLCHAHLARLDLWLISFSEADLRGANLAGVRVSECNFSGANLTDARLEGALLPATDLRDANLTGANLIGADLRWADLRGADCTDADFTDANLSGALFSRTIFAGARLASTSLFGTDVSELGEADPPTFHHGPSRVDYETVLLSVRSPRLADFLQRTGMPELFVTYMIECARSLQGDVFKMLQSTFLSYGGPDEPFVRRLYEFLHRNGVTTFFFPEHAVPGEKLHRTMREGVNNHDRVILVCSKASLDRPGVLNEIEETLAREARHGGASYLIPIRLDDYVFKEWAPPNPDTAQAIRDRVVADFRGAQTDSTVFNAGALRLIEALIRK